MTFPKRNDAWCDFASASSFSADCFSSVFLRLFPARSITSARKRSWSLALSPCFALCGAASTLARSPCTFLIAWSYSSRVFEICAICKQGTKCESAAWFYLCGLPAFLCMQQERRWCNKEFESNKAGTRAQAAELWGLHPCSFFGRSLAGFNRCFARVHRELRKRGRILPRDRWLRFKRWMRLGG